MFDRQHDVAASRSQHIQKILEEGRLGNFTSKGVKYRITNKKIKYCLCRYSLAERSSRPLRGVELVC